MYTANLAAYMSMTMYHDVLKNIGLKQTTTYWLHSDEGGCNTPGKILSMLSTQLKKERDHVIFFSFFYLPSYHLNFLG
jgi:hypothetical protein